MKTMRQTHTPFVLSLSKDCFSSSSGQEGQGFDKLSPNGFGMLLGKQK